MRTFFPHKLHRSIVPVVMPLLLAVNLAHAQATTDTQKSLRADPANVDAAAPADVGDDGEDRVAHRQPPSGHIPAFAAIQ